MIALLLHEILRVQVKLLVVLTHVLQLLLLVFELLLFLHSLERDLVVVEFAKLILLLLKNRLGVPVLGHLLLAVVQCQQIPHAQLVLPIGTADGLALHLRIQVERALEAIVCDRLTHGSGGLLRTTRPRCRARLEVLG